MRKIYISIKKYVIKYQMKLFLYTFFCLCTGLISIYTPILTGDLFDAMISGEDSNALGRFIFIFSTICIINLLLGFLTNLLYINLQTRMGYEYNRDVIKHLHLCPVSFYKNKDITYLTQRINSDTNSVVIFFLGTLQNAITNCLVIIYPIIYIAKTSLLLAVLVIVLSSLFFICYLLFRESLYRASYKFKEIQSSFFAKLNEQLSHVKFIKTHGIEQGFISKLDTPFLALLKQTMKKQVIGYSYTSLETMVSTTMQVAVLVFGGNMVIKGDISIGQLTVLLSYYRIILGGIRYFSSLGKSVQENKVADDRIREIMKTDIESVGEKEIDHIRKLDINNISFSYAEHEIISNFTTHLEVGKTYALIGNNGTGKSTLVNLLIGLQIGKMTGEILINGIMLNYIDTRKLRNKCIAVSEQEPLLIADTLLYNLTLNDHEKINEEKFTKIIKSIGMEDFLSALPLGLNSVVNEKSSNLSGGEKQKIAIARTLLKNADLLILDEPTSALDQESRKNLAVYLTESKQDKIILVITHDSVLMESCDEVIDMSCQSQLTTWA